MALTGKLILIAEDEPDIREILTDAVEDRNGKAIDAKNGVIAFDLFGKNKIDAIVTDIRMKGGDGVELLKKVRAVNKKVPFYVVTGFSDFTGEELRVLGADAVVFKPFDAEELMQIIEERFNEDDGED
jgi:DNA-binding response OmpR family regulator